MGALTPDPRRERAPHRRARRLTTNLVLLAVSLALTILALEVGVRLFARPKGPSHPVFDIDPDRRIAFFPGSSRTYESPEFQFTVEINRFGRRDGEWSEAEMADPENILFIGDSFVFGYGVEEAATLSTQIEAQLAATGQRRQVFNFGMPASGPREYQLLLAEAHQIGIAARTVLLSIFVGNDFHPEAPQPANTPRAAPPPDRRQLRIPRFELIDWLRRRISSSPRAVGWVLIAGRWLGLPVYNTGGSHVFLRHPTEPQEAIMRGAFERIEGLVHTTRAAGQHLVLAIFPNKIQVENATALSSSIYDGEKPNRRLLNFCQQHHLSCLDLLPLLRQEHEKGERLFFPIDRHLTPTGNRIAAQAITEFLGR